MKGPRPVCLDCKHLVSIEGNPKCKAFPEEIPEEIWMGGNNHKKPFPGDHGIQFEPI